MFIPFCQFPPPRQRFFAERKPGKRLATHKFRDPDQVLNCSKQVIPFKVLKNTNSQNLNPSHEDQLYPEETVSQYLQQSAEC